jgi:hypothetical protein
MKLDEIVSLWSKDCEIDQTNISSESANIPKLHNKYYLIYMEEGMKLRKLKFDLKQLQKLKGEYYRGELAMEELQEYGWEPQPLKILKQDIPTYVDADNDVINLSLKIGMQQEKVEYLESIIRQITNRGFQLKTIVDWEKFRTGAI